MFSTGLGIEINRISSCIYNENVISALKKLSNLRQEENGKRLCSFFCVSITINCFIELFYKQDKEILVKIVIKTFRSILISDSVKTAETITHHTRSGRLNRNYER